jgi:SAM-dependent methyltransferase
MSEWTEGYVSEIGYTFGYYSELNPLRLRLAFLYAGLVFPEVGTACELGFGQGVSTNVHASASCTQWFGTDFNPAQAGFAQELAAASGADAQLFDQAFEEFCNRADLPSFDFIGLHGIWSWISDENRAVIVDFIRRKLKVGGVLYISYNTLPGLAAFVPMRHLLKRHYDVMSCSGNGILSGIDSSFAFADKLLATGPAYATANPQMVERLKLVKGQNRNYLAHEYFNNDWDCIHFSEMADLLAPTKLNFACSAHYPDAVDVLNLTLDQQVLLQEIPDAVLRETARDFCVNQQFRRDYWVNGARRLSPFERTELLRQQQVILLLPRKDVSFKATGALGAATLQEAVYGPILDCLSDHQPKSLGQIEQQVQGENINFAQVVEVVMVLVGVGSLAAAQDEASIAKARPRTDRLNAYLCNKALYSPDIAYLASPVTGGAVGMGRLYQLFLLAKSQGKEQPAEWVQSAWQVLSTQGLKVVKEGKTLETAEENMADLAEQAQKFADQQIPILRALGVTA